LIEELTARLAAMGYTATESDAWLLNFVIDKVTHEIKLSCNISEIPVTANKLLVDMMAGEFLRQKKAMGASLGGIAIEPAAKSMKIGDTTIDFGSAVSPEAQFDALIGMMIDKNRNLIVASLRRLSW